MFATRWQLKNSWTRAVGLLGHMYNWKFVANTVRERIHAAARMIGDHILLRALGTSTTA